MSELSFALMETGALLPHEEVEEDRLASLTDEIRRDGCLREPVLVDRVTLIILDGHHRVQALQALGCLLVPAYLVDYRSQGIQVWPWRQDTPVDKDSVVDRGLARRPYPPRTSRHVLAGAPGPRPVDLAFLAALGEEVGLQAVADR
ncbi:MAG: ParB N-terminal domain-containing protein [bacterium]|nr:ParB N-terminal domain-containing protein [bacterium]